MLACSNDGGKKEAIDGAVLNTLQHSETPADEGEEEEQSVITTVKAEKLFSNEIVKDVLSMSSDGDFLYLAAENEIDEYNAELKTRRALAGNQSFPNDDTPDPMDGVAAVGDWPRNLIKEGEYIYYFDGNKLQKLFTGNDRKSAIETIVAEKAMVNSGFHLWDFDCDDNYLFWSTGASDYSKIMAKELNNDSLPYEIIRLDGRSKLSACCNNYLYIRNGIEHSLINPCLKKYDLLGKTLTTVQDNITLNKCRDIPVYCSPDYIYWLNGDSIYRANHISGTVELIISGMIKIIQLTANDSAVYVLQNIKDNTTDPLYTIIKIDLNTSVSEEVYSSSNINHLLMYNSILYWISHNKLYQLDSNGSEIELFDGENSRFVSGFLGALHNRIFIGGDSLFQCLVYDIPTGTQSILTSNSGIPAINSSDLYLCRRSGILRIPWNIEIRQPETITTVPSHQGYTYRRLAVKGDRLFWTEYNSSSGFSSLASIKTDGSDKKVFFESDDPEDAIDGLVLYNDRLYFLYKDPDHAEWFLLSSNLDGEDFRGYFNAGYQPACLTERNGVFYIAVTYDPSFLLGLGSGRSICSMRLNEDKPLDSESAELISGYGIIYAPAGESSSNYHFYASNKFLYYVMPYAIADPVIQNELLTHRSKIVDWATLGDTEVIENSKNPYNTMNYVHDNYFYFTQADGLYRIKE